MSTIKEIEFQIFEIYNNFKKEKVNSDIYNFCINNVNKSGVELKNLIINFISQKESIPIPRGIFTYEEKKEYLKRKICPDFILANINNMFENEGYIWKDRKYFGKKKKNIYHKAKFLEPRFEKTFIHLYDNRGYKKYLKKKGEKSKILIYESSQITDRDILLLLNLPKVKSNSKSENNNMYNHLIDSSDSD